MSEMPKRSRGASRSRVSRSDRGGLGRSLLALALLGAGLVLASAFIAIEIQRNALGRQAAALQAGLVVAEAAHAQLVGSVATKTTDDYVMNKARDYGYVLPGEALIGVQQDAATPAILVSGPSTSHVQRWLALFFGAR